MSLRSTLPSGRWSGTLRQIKIPEVNSLLVKWTAHHVKSMNSNILDARSHPKHAQSKRRWQSRTDPLWWNCLTSTKSGGNKRIVRAWLSNRARVAFTKALNDSGYAKDGARLVKESGDSAKGDLVGSLHFLVLPGMLHTSWEDVCREAKRIVATVEGIQIKGDSQSQGKGERKGVGRFHLSSEPNQTHLELKRPEL